MKKAICAVSLLSLLALAPLAVAQTQPDHGQHGMTANTGGDAMQMMNPSSVMLGEQTVDGVTAMAHINDTGALMAKMGKPENYHFMVMLNDAKTGAAINEGTVAVKITDPAGKTGEPVELMGMQGHFGADILLPAKGSYSFQVGTKLKDGSKRQFQFSTTIK